MSELRPESSHRVARAAPITYLSLLLSSFLQAQSELGSLTEVMGCATPRNWTLVNLPEELSNAEQALEIELDIHTHGH